MVVARSLEDGTEQILAGLSLVHWSGLATWNAQEMRFETVDEGGFEMAAALRHRLFGRLICWITFSVGAEYILKGTCISAGVLTPTSKSVLSAPGEDLEQWTDSVLSKRGGPKESVPQYGALGDVNKKIEQLPRKHGVDLRRVQASFEFLRDAIRNRDLHRYAKNIRTMNFPTVEALLLPAINDLLKIFGTDRLPPDLDAG